MTVPTLGHHNERIFRMDMEEIDDAYLADDRKRRFDHYADRVDLDAVRDREDAER